jgi:hypothetical protein
MKQDVLKTGPASETQRFMEGGGQYIKKIRRR